MNPIIERLELLKKGLKNFDKVVEGVWNNSDFANLSQEKKDVIAERLSICGECPYNSINAKASEEYFALFGKHYETTRNDLHCSMCGCLIKAKVASLSSSCGLEIYNSKHKDNKQSLKWKAYEKS